MNFDIIDSIVPHYQKLFKWEDIEFSLSNNGWCVTFMNGKIWCISIDTYKNKYHVRTNSVFTDYGIDHNFPTEQEAIDKVNWIINHFKLQEIQKKLS